MLPSVGLAACGFLLGWFVCGVLALPNVPPAYLLTARLVLNLLALGVSALMFCQLVTEPGSDSNVFAPFAVNSFMTLLLEPRVTTSESLDVS